MSKLISLLLNWHILEFYLNITIQTTCISNQTPHETSNVYIPNSSPEIVQTNKVAASLPQSSDDVRI